MPIAETPSTPLPSSPQFTVGQKLAGVYVLRKEITSGGDAPIWLAHDEVLGKDVSLHFIPAVLRQDERSMSELRQEIKRNRQLIHPGILRVYDLVDEPDWSAISMDWFEGQSLAALLKDQPSGFFEPGEIKPWLQQVCHTLEDIHKIQIVHRDVAPHNIFVDGKGRVLIAKFGIGRVIEDAKARAKVAGADARLATLSPQQLDGEHPSKLDDVYSLGATIYELLTGELPFTGENLLAQIRKNPPQPMAERRAKLGRKGGAIPPAWEKWVAAALGKASTDRPATVGELVAKLGLTGKPGAESSTVPMPTSLAAAPAAQAEKIPATAPLPAPTAPAAETTKPAEPSPAPALATPTQSKAPAPAAESSATSIAAIAAATAPSLAQVAAFVPAATAKSPAPAQPPVPTAPVAEKAVQPSSQVTDSSAPKITAAGLTSTSSEKASLPVTSKHPSDPTGATAPTTEVPHYTSIDEEEEARDAALRMENGDSAIEDEKPKGFSTTTLAFAALVLALGGAAYYFNQPSEAAKGYDPLAAQATPAPVATPTPDATPTPQPLPADAAPAPAGTNVPSTPAPTATPVGSRATANGTDLPVGSPSPESLTGEPLLKKADMLNDSPERLVDARNGYRGEPLPANNTQPVPPPPLFVPTGDTEKDYLNATKLKQTSEAAVAETEKEVQTRTKALQAVQKASEPIQKQRTQKAALVTTAEDEAKKARATAEAKVAAVEQAKKTLAEWETANAPKLAGRDKATTELETAKGSLTVRQQQVAEMTKVLASLETAHKELAAREKQKADAEQARLAALKAQEEEQRKREEAARTAAEDKKRKTQEIADSIRRMQEQLQELQKDSTLDPGAANPKGASAAPLINTPTPTPTPAPVAALSTPRTIPQPPPSPQPVRGANRMQEEFLPLLPTNSTAAALPATPIEVVKLTATPGIRSISSTPPPATPAATPAIEPSLTTSDTPAEGISAGGENSLGMKFAPVGNVAFCVWPTRIKDFEIFAKETGLRSASWRNPGFKQGPDHPVVNVSWRDAMGFCDWLTARERKRNLLTKDQSYRLPTDLEWSKAVGLPDETGRTPEARDMGVPDVFPWGTQWPPPPNVGNYTGEETNSDVAIKGYDDGFAWTSPVGSFPPNALGLYDVGGNVWQWCMDNWSNDSKAKVLRGASWYNGALKLSLLSSCRVSYDPENFTDNYGFRIVKVNEGARSAKAGR